MRCNTGGAPSVLLDQHLIAEYRELLIPFGQLRSPRFNPRMEIPRELALGKGHITFWRDKQLYLKRRHEALVAEMIVRGFVPNYSFWPLEEIPLEYQNDWNPKQKDSDILRDRIRERVLLKPHWYRMKGNPLSSVEEYLILLRDSPMAF